MSDTNYFPIEEQVVFISGPVGTLELLATSESVDSTVRKVGVICHPHPQFGGTMQNKVVTTLHKAFQELGMRTVRFNYRGVGKSVGDFAEGIGETQDTVAVLDWVSQTCPGYEIYLAGFSFGAYVSYRVATDTPYRERLRYLVSITMPQYPGLATLMEPICPWLLVQGEMDEVIVADEVFAWVQHLQQPPVVIKMPETSHFFHGKLVTLRTTLVEHLL